MGAQKYGYFEPAFHFFFNDNGEIESLTEFEDRSCPTGYNDVLFNWDGLYFGPNLFYAEEYEIPGDPGEYKSAPEAAKLAFDAAKLAGCIPGYNGSMAYEMTLVDLAEINAEACYVYRCDGADFAMGLAYAYQSGGLYLQGDGGQGAPLDTESADLADVPWWGEYNSVNYVLGITNYNGTSFHFTIDDVDGDISGVAALDPADPYLAQYEELVFMFDGVDTIGLEGGDYAETYFRSQMPHV